MVEFLDLHKRIKSEQASLLEADLKSELLAKAIAGAGGRYLTLVGELHKGLPVQWSELTDEDVHELLPDDARKPEYKDYLLFWKTTRDIPRSEHDFLKWDLRAGDLIAISKGKKIMDISDRFGQVNNISKPSSKKIAELADAVYGISPETLEKYSAKEIQTQRAKAKAGAVALMDPKVVKKQNQNRYEEILKNKYADTDVKKAIKEFFSLTQQYVDKTADEQKLGRYNEIVVSGLTNFRGEEISARNFANLISRVWSDLGDYSRDVKNFDEYQKGGWNSDYIESRIKTFKKNLVKAIDALKRGKADIW